MTTSTGTGFTRQQTGYFQRLFGSCRWAALAVGGLASGLATDVRAQMPPALVEVAPVVEREVVLGRPLVASIEAVKRTSLAAEQEGFIAERLFDEGQTVSAGQELVRLDVQLLASQRDAATAAVLSADAMIRQARARQQNWTREAQRMQDLFANQAVSEKEVSDARTELEIADAEVELRNAELLQRQAELQRLNLMLEKSVVRSPMDAVVGQRSVEIGQWLRQGDTVAELVQLNPLYVRMSVPEFLIGKVSVGTSARVVIPALQNLELTGVVDQVLPQADAATRTFAVRLLVKNDDLKVRPGFFARVTLDQPLSDGAVVVPHDAVVTSGNQSHVVVAREGVAAIVPVALVATDGHYEVVQGELKAGDLVIVRGNETAIPGQPLIIANVPASGSPQGAPAHGAPEAGAPADASPATSGAEPAVP